jgi:uncharacterized protein
MQSKEKKNIVFIRLMPKENLIEKIKQACKKHDISSAVVLSGIGQLDKAELGYFKEKGNYSPEIFEKPLEILSISGNICKQEDEYLPHLHIVLGDEKKKALGGHLLNGTVSVTAEIVILKTNIDFKRELDENTGLQNMILE